MSDLASAKCEPCEGGIAAYSHADLLPLSGCPCPAWPASPTSGA